MYSRQEVAKHCTPQDAWVIYKSKVLDVTAFLKSHPGGAEVLMPLLGQDVSEAFATAEHSYCAIRMIEDMRIGVLEGSKNGAEKPKKQLWDPKKGMVWQVWKNLSLEDYLDMVNHPTHLPYHVRLFDSPYLEPLTKTKWFLIPLIWLPVAAYFFYLGLKFGALSVIFFFLGLLVWTLMEYGLHRYVFHSEAKFKEENKALTTLHFLSHGIHHAFPMDDLRLVFPPALSFILSFIVKGIFNTVFPLDIRDMVFAGTIVGYVWYDVCHFYIHHSKTHFAFTQSLKEYHMYHHYRSPLLGFGVSNKLWDIVFGTEILIPKQKPRVKSD